MRYRLRTLLIALAVGPPLLAVAYFGWRLMAFAVIHPASTTDGGGILYVGAAAAIGMAWAWSRNRGPST